MTETTTIQITTEQADQLRELRQYDDEPYKSIIARLLEQETDANVDYAEVERRCARAVESLFSNR